MTPPPSTPPRGIDKYSPDALLTGYSRTRIVAWLGIALLVHVVLIGLFSLGRWIRSAVPEPEALSAEAGESAATAAEPVATNRTAAVPQGADDIPADRRDAPVVDRISDVADPDELPRAGELDLRIEDTSPW